MQKKTYPLSILFLFGCVWAFTQPCPDFARIMREAAEASAKDNFRLAIRKYNAAKVCDPTKASEVDKQIFAVFDNIEKRRIEAVELKKEAEIARKNAVKEQIRAQNAEDAANFALIEVERQSLKAKEAEQQAKAEANRADSTLRIVQKNSRATFNLLEAVKAHINDPTLAFNIVRYNTLKHTDDPFTAPYYYYMATKSLDEYPFYKKTFSGHQGGIKTVAFSPDGQWIASGSEDKTIKIISLKTGRTVTTLVGHTESVRSVAFSPNSRFLASGSEDNFIKIWSLEKGEAIQTLLGHTAGVKTIAFSSDGKFLASGGDDNLALLWSVDSGELLKKFEKHTGAVWSIALSRDGKKLLTGSSDKTAILWSIDSSKIMKTFSGHSRSIWSVAFSPDDKQVLTGSEDKTAKLWTLDSRPTPIRTFEGHKGSIWTVAFLPDGDRVATGSEDKTVKIWVIQGDKGFKTFSGHKDGIAALAIAPNGKSLLTGSADKTVKLWAIEPDWQRTNLYKQQPQNTDIVVFSPTGAYSLILNSDKAELWGYEQGKALGSLTVSRINGSPMALSKDGLIMMTRSVGQKDKDNDILSFISTATWMPIKQILIEQNALSSAAIAPSNDLIAVGFKESISILSAKTGEELKKINIQDGSIQSLTFSHNGKWLLTGNNDNIAQLISIETGEILKTFRGHQKSITAVAFSNDNKYVLTASKDKTARIWSIETGVHLKTFILQNESPTAVSFSPDDKWLLTWNQPDKNQKKSSIQKWSVENDCIESPFQIHSLSVSELYQADIKIEKDDSLSIAQAILASTKQLKQDSIDYWKTINAWKETQINKQEQSRRDSYNKSSKGIAVSEDLNLITPLVKKRIISVVNVFETGQVNPEYDAIAIVRDGSPDQNGNPTRQITYGSVQITENGSLKELIKVYVDKKGQYAEGFNPYLPKISVTPLADDAVFIDLLKKSGREDTLMHQSQDSFFDERYYKPALKFFNDNGFTNPLSLLVIYDSYIHSGSIPSFIRARFKEPIPNAGGDEKKWIADYVQSRQDWLLSKGGFFAKMIYRTETFKREMELDNWLLNQPVLANGVVSY